MMMFMKLLYYIEDVNIRVTESSGFLLPGGGRDPLGDVYRARN